MELEFTTDRIKVNGHLTYDAFNFVHMHKMTAYIEHNGKGWNVSLKNHGTVHDRSKGTPTTKRFTPTLKEAKASAQKWFDAEEKVLRKQYKGQRCSCPPGFVCLCGADGYKQRK